MSNNPLIKQIEIDNTTYDFGVTIDAGTCTSLAPGSTPTVENVGTIHEAVFNFGIPRGSKGDTSTITIGTVTTLATGSNATVVNSGTSTDAVFDIGLPRGEKGEKGDKGDSYATVTLGTVSTLAAGSDATITNSGTVSDAVFNFGIPKGDKGDKGDPGDSTTEETVTVTAVDSVNTATIEPETNVIYTVPNTVASLIIDTDEADWEYCTIKWTTGSTAPSLTVDSNSQWYGYDCASGVFTPVASAEYRIAVEKDGSTFFAYVVKLG